MELIKGMYSGFRDWYSTVNPATLSGAIDVVVVEQEDGALVCSPFHVRFGKIGVLRSTEKLVDIEINGEPVENLFMKLGENGEAFFVEETTEEEESLSPNLATSPIPSDVTLMEEGIRRLHAGEIIHSDEENLERTAFDEDTNRRVDYTEEPLMQDHDEAPGVSGPGRGADVDMDLGEMGGKGVSRQLKLKSPLIAKEDTDSSLEEGKDGRQEKHEGSSLPRASGKRSRTKLRKKRKRSLRGTVSSTEVPTKTGPSQVQRQVSLSDSNEPFSSSDELDELCPGVMFTLDDVEPECSSTPPRIPPIVIPRRSQEEALASLSDITQEDWSTLSLQPTNRVFHVFSEGDMTPLISPEGTRPPTPKSDTELQMNRPYHNSKQPGSISENEKIEWNWGELPEATPTRIDATSVVSSVDLEDDKLEQGERKKKTSLWDRWPLSRKGPQSEGAEGGGMYLDDLASDAIDPEVYALYFPEGERRLRTISQDLKDEDKSSDLGASLPQSPNTVESGCESTAGTEELRFNNIQLSLCGGLKVEEGEVPLDKFNEHIISFEKFCTDPMILNNPNLVVQMGGKFYTWAMAAPLLISVLAFRRHLPEQTMSTLMKPQSSEAGRRSLTEWFWPRNYTKTGSPRKDDTCEEGSQEGSLEQVVVAAEDQDKPIETKEGEAEEQVEEVGIKQATTERYKKSIRLSSEELKKLNLKYGPNHVCFSVTTRYQGTTQCHSTIYLWRHNSKVIVSDIDGTITKSDVFGQILPVIGKDWTHSGVANLFDGIKKNGYEFVFLSARAIGQSKVTKDYLKGIVQDSLSLPDGPLLLNPSSLLRALHREVIIKNPEEFKIRCLKDIQSLFPLDDKEEGGCFYAGFGNRINDTWAYRAVGIPSARVFTINPQGKVTHEFTKSFQTSYPLLRHLTDQLFPPIDRMDRVTLVEPGQFSTFTYWRQPLPEIDSETILKG